MVRLTVSRIQLFRINDLFTEDLSENRSLPRRGSSLCEKSRSSASGGNHARANFSAFPKKSSVKMLEYEEEVVRFFLLLTIYLLCPINWGKMFWRQ